MPVKNNPFQEILPNAKVKEVIYDEKLSWQIIPGGPIKANAFSKLLDLTKKRCFKEDDAQIKVQTNAFYIAFDDMI